MKGLCGVKVLRDDARERDVEERVAVREECREKIESKGIVWREG